MFANIFHVCKLMTFPSAVKSVMNFQWKGINNNENTSTPANNRSFFRKFPGNVKPKPKCFRAIINFPKQNSDLAHQNTKQFLKYSTLSILVFISIFCGLLAGARVFFRARV